MRLRENYLLTSGVVAGALALVAVPVYVYRQPEPQLVVAVVDELGWIRGVLDRFKKDHRGLEFELYELSYNELKKRATASIIGRAGVPFDVVVVDQPWLAEFNPWLKELPVEQAGLLPPAVLNAVGSSHDGTGQIVVHGIPYTGNFELFAINRKLLPERQWPQDWPATWEQVVKIAREFRLKRNGIPYAQRASADDSSMTDEFMAVYWGQHSNTPQAVKILSDLIQLSPRIPVFRSAEISSLLLHGKAAMGIVWSDWAMKMGDADPDLVRRDVAFGPVPGGVPELGIWLLSVAKNARHPDEARAFVEFAARPDQLRESVLKGNPPITEDLLRDKELASRYGYFFGAQQMSMRTTRARPLCAKWHDKNEPQIAGALRQLYFEDTSPDKAALEIGSAPSACLE